MTADTNNMKKQLEEELAAITEDLQGLGIHNPHVKEDWIATPEGVNVSEADPNVVADRSEDWAERRGTLDALETRYNNINRALAKIEKDAYGICEIGGEEIELDRLNANPAARTCKTHINDEASLSN
jgi:RNA polymerase-binding transcription factor DksA